MKLSLRTKTIIGVALIEAALLMLLVFTAVSFIGTSINEGLVKRASTTATLFATTTKDAVLSYDLASLDAFVNELMKNPDMEYVKVINSSDNLLAFAGKKKYLRQSFEADKEVDEVQDGVFDISATIEEGGEKYGQVEIGIAIDSLQAAIKKLQKWTSSLAMTEMILVALFSYVLGTYLTNQLSGLQRGARAITRGVKNGEFADIHVKVQSQDELGDVAMAFNTMIRSLHAESEKTKETQLALEELNQTLEEKVERRTQQLSKRNDQLLAANIELKETQQQLLQAEKMASLGQLAAGVAHEINNPIGFVTSNLGTLQEYVVCYKMLSEDLKSCIGAQDEAEMIKKLHEINEFMKQQDIEYINEDSQELLNESKQGLERVKEIVQGLKQFSRADTNEFQLCDINECVNTTLKMVGNELKYHCDVVTNFADIPNIPINIGKISQVLTNILINAGQAINENGKISVTTKYSENKISVVVTDNGKGINSEDMERLFDPFFTTKEQGEGTGLGLSISYGIMQEHGGDIQVESEPGVGTSFSLNFPVNNAAV